MIDVDGRLHAEGPAARIDPVGGVDCDVVAPRIADVAPLATPAAPVAEPVIEPAAATPAPVEEPAAPVAAPEPTPEPQPAPEPETDAPASTGDRLWMVAPGDSLWQIVQEAYGVSDDAQVAPLVNLVFETNGDQIADPSVLNVGTTLRIPELRF